MKVGEFLLGKSYGALGGELESVSVDPSDTSVTQEDEARLEVVQDFVATLPRPNIAFDYSWSPVAVFEIPGNAIAAYNTSVIWMSTRVGTKSAVDYPYYVVGMQHDEENPRIMLAPAEIGADMRTENRADVAKKMVIVDLKNRKQRFYKYIESKLEGNERLLQSVDPAQVYSYAPSLAYLHIGLTSHYYRQMQELKGISEQQWQDFGVEGCLKNLMANFESISRPVQTNHLFYDL